VDARPRALDQPDPMALACRVSRRWQCYPRGNALAIQADMATDMLRWHAHQAVRPSYLPLACQRVQSGDPSARLDDGENRVSSGRIQQVEDCLQRSQIAVFVLENDGAIASDGDGFAGGWLHDWRRGGG